MFSLEKVMKRYEIITHTADIGIKVYAKTLEDLFKNSASLLIKLISKAKPKNNSLKKIKITAETWEDLLINWLNELVFLFFAYRFAPQEFQIKIKESAPKKKILEGKVKGEYFKTLKDLKIHTEIKAATYHNLKIEKDEKGYKAQIIFDV